MSRLLIVLATIIAALGCSLWISVDYARKKEIQCDILSQNQHALLQKTLFYQTRDSLSVAGVERLLISKREMEEHCYQLIETIKKLKLKTRRVESASTTAIENSYQIRTIVKDSVVYLSPGGDSVQYIDYNDTHITVRGNIKSGVFSGSIQTCDTIMQVVHRVPRRFLFLKFGTKAIRQEVVSTNPHSKIVYSQYLELR